MSSTRVGTRISSRINKLAGRKITDRDTIQQLCDQPISRKIMTWLDTVLHDEALTESEYNRWLELEQTNTDDLFSADDSKIPAMKMEKESLSEEIANLQHMLDESEQRENLLSKQHSLLSQQSQQVFELSAKSATILENSDSLKAQAATKVLQHRHEDLLTNLGAIVKDHIQLHDEDQNSSKYLSHLPLDDYINSELEYTKALGAYSQKIFFPGISTVPGNPKECELVGIDDENKENKRYSQGVNYRKIKDTVRIVKSTYMASQEENIAVVVNLAADQAKIKALKEMISNVSNEKYPKDESTLLRMTEEFSIQCVKKEHDLELKWKNEALPLLQELTNLQDISILCGDYKLKLARQNYFMARQDQIIAHLVAQLSRQELLQIMMEGDLKTHKDNTTMLRDITAHITDLSRKADQQKRLVAGEDAIVPVKSDKLCIGSNDKTLNSIVEMMKQYLKNDYPKLFYTFTDLETAIKSAIADHDKVKGTSDRLEVKLAELVSTLDADIMRCAQQLEKGCTNTSQEEDTLETALGELDDMTICLKDEYNLKSEMPKIDQNVCIGRKLFVYFFTDQEILRKLLGATL